MKLGGEFYMAQEREGFYIPSEMKRCWAATLSVLEVIDTICRRHNLEYFADYGTMLGAVRHGGFIPWDDDFDISMKRRDYMLFLKYAREEVPKDYEILSFYTNHKYDNYLTRVVSREFVSVEEKYLISNHGFPYVTGVDIFPLDNFEENEEDNPVIKNLIKGAQAIAQNIDADETDINNVSEGYREKILYFCDVCGYELIPGEPIPQQMFILSDRLSQMYDESSSKVANMYFYVEKNIHVYPKEWFEHIIRIPFENSSIPVPVCYDRILQDNYGNDYMTPVMSWDYHDYPVYKGQKEVLTKAFGRPFYKEYVFEKGDIEREEVEIPTREKKEAVFLPFSGKYWSYLEKEWIRLTDDPDWDVYVIPIPFYEKVEYGIKGDIHYEGGELPDYVPVTGFDKYDFDRRIPDRIYIQNPYDDYDNAMTVHPRFYTENLRSITKELIYIPYFEVMDFRAEDERMNYAAQFYVKVPGVTRADKIILSSEVLKERYIEILCDFAGGNTREIWEKRIVVDPGILPDKVIGIYEEEVPTQWWKYLLDENGEGKKVLLYHTNVGDIALYGDKYLEKIRRNLAVFEENRDKMTVLWHAHFSTQSVLEIYYPEIWNQYTDIVGEFLQMDLGIYEDGEDTSKSVAVADAYFGDRDVIMNQCRRMGKPIMIQNVEI